MRQLLSFSLQRLTAVVTAAVIVATAPVSLALASSASAWGGGIAAQSAVPTGTHATLRLSTWLSSKNAAEGDTFEATLKEDITLEGEVIVPAGVTFVGRVAAVEHAKRPSTAGKLTLVVDELLSGNGYSTPALGTITGLEDGEELEGESRDAGKAAKTGVIGGVLGGLLGGVKGALLGIVLGAGGSLAASSGEDVELPEGTYLQVTFDREVDVTWTWRAQESSQH